jgi:hypothetical protein
VTSTEARYLLRASRAAGEELGSSFSMTDGHHHIDLRVIGFCRVRSSAGNRNVEAPAAAATQAGAKDQDPGELLLEVSLEGLVKLLRRGKLGLVTRNIEFHCFLPFSGDECYGWTARLLRVLHRADDLAA